MADDDLRYDVELRAVLDAVAALGGLVPVWKDADPALAHALPRALREHRQPRCVEAKEGAGLLATCVREDDLDDRFWRGRGDRAWWRCCHAGLRELLVPVRLDGELLGTCFIAAREPAALDRAQAAAAARLARGAIAALAPLRGRWRQVHPDRLARHPAIARAVRLIEREARADLRAAALAREVGLSRSRFAHAFAEVVGESFTAFRRRCVLWRARRALAASDEPIGEIAWRLGWRNQNYFATAFRQGVGLTPSAYRRAVRRGEVA